LIISYLRSSAESAYRQCPLRHFIDYTLSKKSPSSVVQNRGSAVHKALELLALRKLGEQNGTNSIVDDAFGPIDISEIEPEEMIRRAIDHYYDDTWQPKDAQDARKWFYTALSNDFYDGVYNPLTQNIVSVEESFDYTFEQPWAYYNYKVGDETIEGQFSIKGVSDLQVESDGDTLNVRDYKTGSMSDWASGKQKDYEYIQKDFQLLLYGFAMKRKFPQYKYINLSLIYLKFKKVLETFYDEEKDAYIEKKIQETFERIRRDMKPRANRSFKCKWCHWDSAKNKAGTTACQFFDKKVQSLGADKVFELYGDRSKIENYQSGGGKEAKE
jgi:CRISPR/Cas system-associated exonuclease Cas4 (RecB family)